MIMQDIMDACNPSSTTNILEIHGTNDDVTYYDGDPTVKMVGELIRAFLKPWRFDGLVPIDGRGNLGFAQP